MLKKIAFPFFVAIVLGLSACNGITPGVPTALPTEPPPSPTLTMPPTSTLVPSPTPTLTPAITAVPTFSFTGTAPSNPNATNYIDDRSTPSQVIVSFYNAVNRKEYLRAYSYYGDPEGSLGSYASFSSGYQDTASVDLVFGQISGDAGMSQIYYTVPVILKVTTTANTHVNYSACYVVHETNPSVYGAPPISPMNIHSGSAVPSQYDASDASVLATACDSYPSGGGVTAAVGANSLSIDKSNFVDNRSGPIETVSSLLNAINLQQYVRAYSYFQDPANFPGTYDSYAAGFSDTDTISVVFGSVTSEGAAGSVYYKVPLAETVLDTNNTTHIFVGCYTLRLSQPAVQGTPPFQPMGIIAGQFSQVNAASQVNSLLPTACQ